MLELARCGELDAATGHSSRGALGHWRALILRREVAAMRDCGRQVAPPGVECAMSNLATSISNMLLSSGFPNVFPRKPSALDCAEPIVVTEGAFVRESRLTEEERGSVPVTVMVVREVAGDAALFFDPYNIDDIAKAIEKMATDSALRSQLSQKGLERAKLFQNTDAMTDDYVKVFEEAMKKEE